jgi:hypothetical protein
MSIETSTTSNDIHCVPKWHFSRDNTKIQRVDNLKTENGFYPGLDKHSEENPKGSNKMNNYEPERDYTII